MTANNQLVASAQTFHLPDLGEGLTEAEIVRWLVSEGDVVAIDQCVVEVETAKSIVEVPTPYAGEVQTLHAAAGTTLEVGLPLITVLAPGTGAAGDGPVGDATEDAAATYREEEMAGSGNVLIGYGTSESASTARRRRPRQRPETGTSPTRHGSSRRAPRVVSPLVRRIAKDAGVDLAGVAPSAPSGVIRRVDVERAIAAVQQQAQQPAAIITEPAGVSAGETRTPMTGFRKAVSAALSRSRSEIPEATVWVDVDATALWELREARRAAGSASPGLLAYIARFVVAALKEYPVLNARLDTDTNEIVELHSINLGVAVQGERGLVVPAVMAAESMNALQLDGEIRRLTAAAREGRATPEELAAGTFTLNNYGSFRVDGSAAIINHPQVAILGFGRIIDRPWVVDGDLCVRKITQMSFVFDHRICDGGTAAGFMRSVADAIEDPNAAIDRL